MNATRPKPSQYAVELAMSHFAVGDPAPKWFGLAVPYRIVELDVSNATVYVVREEPQLGNE